MSGRTLPRRSRRAGHGPLGDLGRSAARRRHQLGITQHQLALLADVGERSVQSLEAGKLSLRIDVLLKILDAIGLALVAMPKSEARQLSMPATVVVEEGRASTREAD